MLNIKLQNLPPFGKLFVGTTTVLMLCVCLWSMIIFYVDKGLVDEDSIPLYLQEKPLPHQTMPTGQEIEDDIEKLSNDSLAELAPMWDNIHKGENIKVDSATMAQKFPVRDSQLARLYDNNKNEIYNNKSEHEGESHIRHNVGLAHTHINGQTLLYFVLGFLFLFCSAKDKIKIFVYSVCGLAVFMHTVCLTGEGFHWLFDDLLALSGVTLLAVIPYMCLLIIVDLFKLPETKHE